MECFLRISTQKVRLTEGILGDNTTEGLEWFRLALLVDRLHAELVFMSGNQTINLVKVIIISLKPIVKC